jgi:hypothetical protein
MSGNLKVESCDEHADGLLDVRRMYGPTGTPPPSGRAGSTEHARGRPWRRG